MDQRQTSQLLVNILNQGSWNNDFGSDPFPTHRIVEDLHRVLFSDVSRSPVDPVWKDHIGMHF